MSATLAAAVTGPPPLLSVEVDHRVESPNRLSNEDPRDRARRRRAEERVTIDALRGWPCPPLPVRVTLTRIGPRVVDDDNLAGAFKAVRDAIADWFGTDDGPGGGIAWHYAQEKQRVPTETRPGRQGRVIRGKHAFRVWFRITVEPWDGCSTKFVQLDLEGPHVGDEDVRVWKRPPPKTESGIAVDVHERSNGSQLRVARKSAPDRPHYVNVYWRLEWSHLRKGKRLPPRVYRTSGVAFRERAELEAVIPALQAELEAWRNDG